MLTKAPDIDKCSRFNLAIYMAIVLLTSTTGDILLLKCHAILLRRRDEPKAHCQRKCRNKERTEEVGPHKSLKRHTSREHRHNLCLIGELGGKEYHGNKCKESGELIDKKRHKLEVIVKNNCRHRCMHLCKVVNLLHIVKDHYNHDNHRNCEEICSHELTQNISI